MEKYIQFVTKNCLEWITDSPFLDCPKQSPIFSFLGIDWYLSLDLTVDEDEYYRFKLYVHNVKKKELLTKAILTVFVTRYDKYYMQKYLTSGVARLQEKETIIFNDCIEEREELHEYYGRLTVLCNFSADLPSELRINGSKGMQLLNLPALEGQHSSTVASILMKVKLASNASDDSFSDVEDLIFDFGKLLEQKSHSDVTLMCGDRTFSAHRNILTARSDVFAAMFQNKMVESETGSIDIKDIDGEDLDLLLKYVYTGKISDLSVDIASRLYTAADKYSIQSLKNKCSKWMLGSLTKENCLDFIILADTSNDERFKDMLINFIAEILHLLEEDAWQKFSDKHPKLSCSVYHRRVFTKTV